MPAFISNAAAQQGEPPLVTVNAPVKKQIVDWAVFSGQFVPIESVEIRARVAGPLTEIHFADGQIVKKGDVLFVIDPRPYDIALASAVAKREQAKASLELASNQLNRAESLRQKDVLTQSVYEERQQQKRVAAAMVDVAQASVREAELNLEFTRITSPISGRIGMHMVSIGNLVTGGPMVASPTVLTSIVSLDPIEFLFDQSEADHLAHHRARDRAVAAGKLPLSSDDQLPVFLQLADETSWTREGRLAFTDNQINRGSGTIRAGAIVPNPDFLLTPGQFARLRLPISAPYDALLVPDEALVTDQSRKVVLVVGKDGTVAQKVVQIGPLEDGLRVVREGLQPDDQVIVTGLLRAHVGAKVKPQLK